MTPGTGPWATRTDAPLLVKRREPIRYRRVLLLPAFYESPANSARLAGRGPLTSRPVRPHVMILPLCRGLIKPRRPLSAAEAVLDGALHLALGSTACDLAPLVVLPLAAGDGELELYVVVAGVEPQGDEGLAVLLALTGEARDLSPVQEQLAVTSRVLGDVGRVLVR